MSSRLAAGICFESTDNCVFFLTKEAMGRRFGTQVAIMVNIALLLLSGFGCAFPFPGQTTAGLVVCPLLPFSFLNVFLLCAPSELGNGRITISRVLFQRKELTEPH